MKTDLRYQMALIYGRFTTLTCIRIANKNSQSFAPMSEQSRLRIEDVRLSPMDKMVHIQWSSQHEPSRMKFKVQISTNKIFWKTLSLIPSKGPSQTVHNYDYFDKSLKKGGKFFYRIVAINDSGKRANAPYT